VRAGQAISITHLLILLAGKRLIALPKVIIVTVIMCACLQIALAKPGAPVIGRSLRYCNPLPLEASSKDGSPRSISLGDVTVVLEGNQYYMFCTGGGAWVSQDLVNWQYRPVQGRVPVAPGIVKYKGTFYMSGNGAPLYRARDILGPYESLGDWKDHKGQPWTGTANNGRTWTGAFDVHFFIDQDQPYLYYPGRGAEGIYVVPLDPNDLTRFAAAPKHLFGFDKSHRWERYGEMNEYSEVTWIEGPWMIKRNDSYYLEYSASGTQWLSYATGVYTSKHPLGPFTYAPGNPVLRKTTGVVTGPGHGCVIKGPDGNFWQFYTIVLANPPGGRRIGMDPVGFDEKGNLFVRGPSETPQWAPGVVDDPVRQGDSGSVPLTINKVRAMRAQSTFSSQRPGHEAPYAVDNANGTWWEPAADDKQPSLILDLGPATEFDPVQRFIIDSFRIEFVAGRGRFGFGFGGRSESAQPTDTTIAHQYKIEASTDGDTYTTVLDKMDNRITKYVEFKEIPPTACRFVRLTITGWPRVSNINLGIMEFTVFGKPIEP
jgi:xylan 1,4-beta-xylosidase